MKAIDRDLLRHAKAKLGDKYLSGFIEHTVPVANKPGSRTQKDMDISTVDEDCKLSQGSS